MGILEGSSTEEVADRYYRYRVTRDTNFCRKICIRSSQVSTLSLLLHIYLASSLPARALQSKAPRTINQFSRSFPKFRVWASWFPEITALPTRPLDAALYLENLIQSDSSSSVLHSASCGIVL